jgi:hypothetical protein
MQNTIIPGIKSLKNLSQPSRLQISLHIVFSPCQIGQKENLRPMGELLWLVPASKSVHTTANRADSSSHNRKHIHLLSDNRKQSFLFDVDRMLSISHRVTVSFECKFESTREAAAIIAKQPITQKIVAERKHWSTFFFLTGFRILIMQRSLLTEFTPSNTSLYLPRPTFRTTS